MAKRSSYTAAYKLYLVDLAEQVGNRAAGREHGISEKLIRDWRRKKTELQKLPSSARSQRVGDKPYWPELETKLLRWVLEKQLMGESISGTKIRLKAKSMALKMPSKLVEGFSASSSWLYRFRKRKGLLIKKTHKITQSLPKEVEDRINDFHAIWKSMRSEFKYEERQIGNMDEVQMTFELPLLSMLMPNFAMCSKDMNPEPIGSIVRYEKIHLSVILACLADGTKLTPMVVFEPKIEITGTKSSPEIILHTHKSGIVEEEGIKLWINQVWKNRPEASQTTKACLIFDSYTPHLLNSVKQSFKSANTDMAIMPSSLTTHIMPLGMRMIPQFKHRMAEMWGEWLQAGSTERAQGGKPRRPDAAEWCSWITTAWGEVDAASIIKGFKDSKISALEESDTGRDA